MRTKKTFLNFITDVVPLAIISFLGIYKLKVFINVLGNETLGLYQLYSQIMVYIALVDGGLGSALLYSLYKPNSSKDDEKFNAIVAGAYRIFALIGIIIFGITLLASPFISLFIKNSVFSNQYLMITFLCFSLSNIVEYFFVPYRTIFEVKEKKYIVNICLQVGQIILSVTEIIMLLLGFNFILILLMHSVIKLLSNIVIAILCRKIYPNIKMNSKNRDYGFTKQLKHLVFHKINGLVSYNIDVIIISKILGLASVAIYSTYNYIINMFRNILGKISSSLTAIIGNYLVTNNKEKTYSLYLEFNNLMFFIATILCVPLFFALNGFIDLWYDGKIETSIFLSLAFSIYLFVYIIKSPTTTFVTAAGLFKETKVCALTDTLINLTLSILLVFKFGISGVIVATTISAFIAEICMKTSVVYKNIFSKKSLLYHVENIKFVVITVLDVLIGLLLFNYISINNILIWFIVFSVYFIVNSLLVFLIYKIFGQAGFVNRLKSFKKEK